MTTAKNTSSRILDEALTLFSQHGFEATSVHDIAAAVGIKAPSLYKHFASKQAIMDALVQRELQRHAETSQQLGMPGAGNPAEADSYAKASVQTMKSFAVGLFTHWTTGDASAFRRLLSAERLRSESAATLYAQLFLEGPVAHQTQLFSTLIKMGAFVEGNPQSMALQFWGPILALMELADTAADHSLLCARIEDHIEQFAQAFVKEP